MLCYAMLHNTERESEWHEIEMESKRAHKAEERKREQVNVNFVNTYGRHCVRRSERTNEQTSKHRPSNRPNEQASKQRNLIALHQQIHDPFPSHFSLHFHWCCDMAWHILFSLALCIANKFHRRSKDHFSAVWCIEVFG